ncbi:MAG: cell division protein ZapA [Gemmatimonadaceae bacterium]
MNGNRKSSVKVSIAGEEYTIRSDESPEHTRAVAEYVDQAIGKILRGAGGVDARRAAILAALQITDELFKVRAHDDVAEAIHALSADVRRWLPPAKRGSGA